ncbi:MAG: thioesterase family protein [Bdellovibrionaceae bacterium]|nr:thioesterase family protein [Pseudobdellovibrionaceae bacterium]
MKFLKELKLRQKIRITLETVSHEGKIFKIRQTMVNQEEAIACEMLMTVGFFDLKARKLILPTPEWLTAIGHLT